MTTMVAVQPLTASWPDRVLACIAGPCPMAERWSPVLRPSVLRALRARAFTMDHTIFVDDNFDITKPEDAAPMRTSASPDGVGWP